MAYITDKAIEVVNFIKSKGLEVRFSSEDSFRSDIVDLLSLYRTMDRVSPPPPPAPVIPTALMYVSDSSGSTGWALRIPLAARIPVKCMSWCAHCVASSRATLSAIFTTIPDVPLPTLTLVCLLTLIA